MLITKVKICGITNYDDAVAAMEMGADLLGFNFYPAEPALHRAGQGGRDHQEAPGLRRRLRRLRQQHARGDPRDRRPVPVGLDPIARRRDHGLLPVAGLRQRQDDEGPAGQRRRRSPARWTATSTDAVLLDTFDPEQYGGTGLTFDWNIIGHIAKRIFLAGGITPDNAAEAVELGVYGIDVCSGVESEPGKKDHER